MASNLLRVTEHKVPCQHIRGNAFATLESQEDTLHLAVKQYTPLDNLRPKAGDLTIIGAHANAFPKELYEPLWEELIPLLKSRGIAVRSIWIADVSHQGLSGVINEAKLGNDPTWWDHPRDLLGLINHFREEMKRPFVGIGHSMGGNNLANVALMHPRLFESLILLDPVIAPVMSPRGNVTPANSSALRRDRWPSRQVALESFKRSKFYQAWDPRVLNLWVKYGLRELPTKLYPDVVSPTLPYDSSGNDVTLTTTKHQEVFTFLRPTSIEGFGSTEGMSPAEIAELKEMIYPDLDKTWEASFYRPEPVKTFENIQFLRPSVLYIFGEASPLSGRSSRTDKLSNTGIGLGGSGGQQKKRVKEVVIKDTGHLIPMEKVAETAKSCSDWIASEMEIWMRREQLLKRFWNATPDEDKYTLEKRMKMFGSIQREKKPKI